MEWYLTGIYALRAGERMRFPRIFGYTRVMKDWN